MMRAIKDNGFQFHFNDKDMNKFYTAYQTLGRRNKIESLMKKAEMYAEKLEEKAMNESLKEARIIK